MTQNSLLAALRNSISKPVKAIFPLEDWHIEYINFFDLFKSTDNVILAIILIKMGHKSTT
jgi:hypothetical protein